MPQPNKRPPKTPKAQPWELVERDQKVRDVVIRIARRLASELARLILSIGGAVNISTPGSC